MPFEIKSGRPATLAPRGMVTSPHSLASAAGVDVLRAGGSAIDAAIAASAVLAVVYPHMTGLGGDAFWLIHEGRSGEINYLSGGGKAAAGASPAAIARHGCSEIPLRGIIPATLTVPGGVASWIAAHDAHGRLPLLRVLEAAIGYAREGFPVTARLSAFIDMMRDALLEHPETAALLFPGGEVPRAGAKLANPGLADTLQAIAERGGAGFYEGPVAAEMVRFSREQGGFFEPADLAQQDANWGKPLVGRYREFAIFNTPPPTQGFTVLEMLNLVEHFDPQATDLLGPDRLHWLVQAKQIAYHDRDLLLADPAFAAIPIETLVSREYAASRRGLIDPAAVLRWDQVPSYGSLTGDTVYVAAVDRHGNAASLIQSLYGAFGSCVMAGSTGVILQNRSAYFSLDPAHPNCLAPGKIPMHTLIASMAKRDGRLCTVLGCMGADGQPQIQLQLYTAMIDYGLDIQEALELPRFLSGRFGLGEARDTLYLESRFPAATIAALERRGHAVHRWGAWNEQAGHAHGITIGSEDRMLSGGSDPRSDGAAIGY
ncbi:MAG: gamma-glutamyltransferase [Bradyrhizobium sp.]|nr:gamma-glutamyltransferase [Bradyrhizobium sp.]